MIIFFLGDGALGRGSMRNVMGMVEEVLRYQLV
jgi:hypothetical protein